jgi:hypothetical protein
MREKKTEDKLICYVLCYVKLELKFPLFIYLKSIFQYYF